MIATFQASRRIPLIWTLSSEEIVDHCILMIKEMRILFKIFRWPTQWSLMKYMRKCCRIIRSLTLKSHQKHFSNNLSIVESYCKKSTSSVSKNSKRAKDNTLKIYKRWKISRKKSWQKLSKKKIKTWKNSLVLVWLRDFVNVERRWAF